uniref:Uncharacterized protein n=1 Tax=Meloidogyne enterolobii TaxID=390850 RepID=A0A6V7UY02_MELEN|nr:unnamed protein product [Meloidogyne enterolobii]
MNTNQLLLLLKRRKNVFDGHALWVKNLLKTGKHVDRNYLIFTQLNILRFDIIFTIYVCANINRDFLTLLICTNKE